MFAFNPLHHIALFKNTTNEDKNLVRLLDSERKAASQWQQVATDSRTAAERLAAYGKPHGDDLMDITEKLDTLLQKWSGVLEGFANSYEQYQATLKTIAERENTLSAGRDQKRKLQENIYKVEETRPGAVDKLSELKAELEKLEESLEPGEMEMKNFKRVAMREALYLLMNGMHEMASKTDIIALCGKYVVDELDVTPVPVGGLRKAYKGTEQTERIVFDANKAMEDWKPDGAKLRRTLTGHHGRNPLLQQKQLPPAPSNKNTEKEAEHQDESSLNKPDEVSADEGSHKHATSPVPSSTRSRSPQPASRSTSPVPADLSSTQFNCYPYVHLGLPDHQKLYHFYQNYTPPRPYDEMSKQLLSQRGGVFQPSPSNSTRTDPGGFVLPSNNPNNAICPQPSVSTSSASSQRSLRNGPKKLNDREPPIPPQHAMDTPPSAARPTTAKVSSLLAKFQPTTA